MEHSGFQVGSLGGSGDCDYDTFDRHIFVVQFRCLGSGCMVVQVGWKLCEALLFSDGIDMRYEDLGVCVLRGLSIGLDDVFGVALFA